MMALRLLRWEPATVAKLGELVRSLAPAGGFVAVGGPDAAELHDWKDGEALLDAAGDRWWWGRVFVEDRELTWRCEAEPGDPSDDQTLDDHTLMVSAVVLSVDGDGKGKLPVPEGAEAHPSAHRWKPVAHNRDRPGRLLLWRPDEQRLPVEPTLPRSLRDAAQLAIEIQEYDGPDGVAWRRYRRVVRHSQAEA